MYNRAREIEVKLVKEYPHKPDVDDMIFGDDRTVPSQR